MEDLNQNLTEVEGLFDDYVVEETTTEEVIEETETVDEEVTEDNHIDEETDETTEEIQPFLTVKFNKEDRNLTQEEAIQLAQKGLNYDRIYPNYEKMNKNFGQYESVYNQLSELAEQNGRTVDEYINSLNEMQEQYAVSLELKSLKEQYPGTDENLLRELAKSKINEKKSFEKTQKRQSETEKMDAQKLEIKRQIDKFQKIYPDLDPGELDEEVYAYMDEGYTLLEAYNTVKGKNDALAQAEKQRQIEAAKKNQSNKKKSLGNIGTNGSSAKDDFLSGFSI